MSGRRGIKQASPSKVGTMLPGRCGRRSRQQNHPHLPSHRAHETRGRCVLQLAGGYSRKSQGRKKKEDLSRVRRVQQPRPSRMNLLSGWLLAGWQLYRQLHPAARVIPPFGYSIDGSTCGFGVQKRRAHRRLVAPGNLATCPAPGVAPRVVWRPPLERPHHRGTHTRPVRQYARHQAHPRAALAPKIQNRHRTEVNLQEHEWLNPGQ